MFVGLITLIYLLSLMWLFSPYKILEDDNIFNPYKSWKSNINNNSIDNNNTSMQRVNYSSEPLAVAR